MSINRPIQILQGILKLLFGYKRLYRKSYSQSGEDVIVDRILSLIGVKKPKYLDIGASDPVDLNNTYFFYKKGCNSVNVEADPYLIKKLIAKRPRDINLNVGVAAERGSFDFYVMASKTLNTFSRETAERYASYGNNKIEMQLKIDVFNINEIVSKYFDSKPDFVSLDVEGLELEILKNFDFKRFRPEVFCIETLTYTENNSEIKITEIIDYMKSVDYIAHSDTYINTIFVDSVSWKKRGRNQTSTTGV
jgi:FkbM family methyltransferase